MRRWLPVLLVAALTAPAAAVAHILPTPALVRAGETVRLTLSVPNEREGVAMTALSVTVPPGTVLLAAEPSPGWTAGSAGREAIWRGSLPPGSEAGFTLKLKAPGTPGPLGLEVVERYADGGNVPSTVRVTVGPAAGSPPMRLGRAVVTGVAGLVAIAAALLLVRRRARLQER